MTNGTRRGWGVSVTPRPLFTPGKDPVPIVQEAGWAPEPVWTGAENLASTGIRSPDRPGRSQSLYRLSYPADRPYGGWAINVWRWPRGRARIGETTDLDTSLRLPQTRVNKPWRNTCVQLWWYSNPLPPCAIPTHIITMNVKLLSRKFHSHVHIYRMLDRSRTVGVSVLTPRFYISSGVSRDISVSIVTRLRDWRPISLVQYPTQANNFLFYAFFWVISRRLNFICRHCGTLCLLHLHRQVCLWRWNRQSVPKRRYIKFRRRGITQKKTKYWEQGESLKSRKYFFTQ